MRASFAFVALAVLSGCPGFNKVECRDSTNCDLSSGGVCEAAPTGNQWCAYPDSACPGGFRYSNQDVGDGLGGACVQTSATDAGIDAAHGDAGVLAFDLAYPNEWRFSVAGPISGYFLIVNTSNAPLSTSTLHLESISDDHPTAFLTVTVMSSSIDILPGNAAGSLSLTSKAVLIDSGLVVEPRTNTDQDFLTLEVDNAPAGTYDIHATVVLGLDGLDITLPITIHHLPGPTVYADPVVGKRLKVYR